MRTKILQLSSEFREPWKTTVTVGWCTGDESVCRRQNQIVSKVSEITMDVELEAVVVDDEMMKMITIMVKPHKIKRDVKDNGSYRTNRFS